MLAIHVYIMSIVDVIVNIPCTISDVTPLLSSLMLTPVDLFSPLEATRLTHFLQATRSSGSLHISLKLSPAHSFTLYNLCLAGLPCDLIPSTLPCRIVFARVAFVCITCLSSDLSLINHLQQRVILSNVLCTSSVDLHVGRMLMKNPLLFYTGRVSVERKIIDQCVCDVFETWWAT